VAGAAGRCSRADRTATKEEGARLAYKISLEQKRLLIYQIDQEWFAFGPPAFQSDISERVARGEQPWTG
jgi:hypothetical protein